MAEIHPSLESDEPRSKQDSNSTRCKLNYAEDNNNASDANSTSGNSADDGNSTSGDSVNDGNITNDGNSTSGNSADDANSASDGNSTNSNSADDASNSNDSVSEPEMEKLITVPESNYAATKKWLDPPPNLNATGNEGNQVERIACFKSKGNHTIHREVLVSATLSDAEKELFAAVNNEDTRRAMEILDDPNVSQNTIIIHRFSKPIGNVTNRLSRCGPRV